MIGHGGMKATVQFISSLQNYAATSPRYLILLRCASAARRVRVCVSVERAAASSHGVG